MMTIPLAGGAVERPCSMGRFVAAAFLMISASLAGCGGGRTEATAPSASNAPSATFRSEQAQAPAQSPGARTVIANERGLYFGIPSDPTGTYWPDSQAWADIGAFIGLRHVDPMRRMKPEAVKGVHGLLQHVPAVNTGSGRPYFPYDQFKAYNDAEVAAGRAPLLMTATYQGRKRPLVFAYVSDSGGHDQAVNLGDPRFARFWVDEYANKNLYVSGLQNQWIGLDNCEFSIEAYGVIDDSGNFVSTVQGGFKPDLPFPQDDDEYVSALRTAIANIKSIAPDTKLICNGGSALTEAKYTDVAQGLDGVILEDVWGVDRYFGAPYGAEHIYRIFNRLQGVDRDKVQIFQPRVGSASDSGKINSAVAAYLIFSGPNAFVGVLDDSSYETSADALSALRSALGQPAAAAISAQDAGTDGVGYRLYQRTFDRGMAYLNWTGRAKVIDLPVGRAYVDRNGQPVTQLRLDDQQADYVTYSP